MVMSPPRRGVGDVGLCFEMFGSNADEMPTKLQSNWKIINSVLVSSVLETLRYHTIARLPPY